MPKKVAYQMDDDSFDLFEVIHILTGEKKVKLYNMAASEFVTNYIKRNALEQKVEELQKLRKK